MLTPRFTLDQDDTFLIITIYAPFTNLSETEIFMDETDFRFFSKPYFLRLHLPGKIEETDQASGVYDAQTSSFVVKAPKKAPGERFQGLEMLTELLRPKGATSVSESQKIQIVSESSENKEKEEEEEEIDWYIEQDLPKEQDVSLSLGTSQAGYGFGFKRVDVFSRLLEECQEILDVKNPDSLTWEERKTQRLTLEEGAFNSDHYLCDLFETEDIEYMWTSKSIWSRDLEDDELELSADERERLIGFPAKTDTKFEKELTQSVYFGLVDILFACLYDLRTTDGEHNSESGWTISKLSATLSCLEKFTSLKEVVTTCVRRSLIYPLYRYWRLSKVVLQDVSDVLNQGRLSVVKVLLSIIPIFIESEGRHIFNDLYINQYIVWVQSVRPERLHTLAKSLDSAIRQLTKCDVQLELVELESAAKTVVQEQEKSVMSSLDVTAERDSDDSDSQDSSSDSESSDLSSSTSSEDTESAESLCDVNKPINTLCGVSNSKSLVKDSDDSSDQETSLETKPESLIENLEKDFNAIAIKTEDKSLCVKEIGSFSTKIESASQKQTLLIAENNPPSNVNDEVKVNSDVKNIDSVKVVEIETEKLVQSLEQTSLK